MVYYGTKVMNIFSCVLFKNCHYWVTDRFLCATGYIAKNCQSGVFLGRVHFVNFQAMVCPKMVYLPFLLAASLGAQAVEIGKPHSTVIPLTSKNFDKYIEDPANGFWLIKFYAPWQVSFLRSLSSLFYVVFLSIYATCAVLSIYLNMHSPSGVVTAKSLPPFWIMSRRFWLGKCLLERSTAP